MALPKTAKSTLLQVSLLISCVLVFRIIYIDIYLMLQQVTNFSLTRQAAEFFNNYLALFLTVGCDILAIWLLRKYFQYGENPFQRIVIYLACILIISAIGAIVVNHTILFGTLSPKEEGFLLLGSYITILLFNTIIIVCGDVLLYLKQSKNAIRIEGDKKRKAQYQYQQLKQQLNPHFLFNSLNILDYLVQNDEKQRASDFIKKLASIYRYLLYTGENKLVYLSDEIRFVNLYTDLLKERFTNGLEVHINIPEEYMTKQVIPCGLQLLVENATKHNIISQAKPLHINISIDEKNKKIIVSNNLQLRINPQSTGIGLKNIEKQYMDIAKKSIEVVPTTTEFIVKLPLL